MTPIEITLPFDLTNGNEGRTKSWYKPAKERLIFEGVLQALFGIREPFNHKVKLTITRILGPNQRKFDPLSLQRGNWKEIEDAFVACGWFHDDSCKWISELSTFRQDDTQRENGPAITIRIEDE